MRSRSAPSTALPLDLRSRHAIREFVTQTTIGLTLLLVLSVLHVRTPLEIIQVAERVFTFYSVIEGLRALCSRDMIGGASLNRWDQMAAYALCATFFDLLTTWPS